MEQDRMTDVQIMTIALAVIIPLSMLIYSNSRITEAKETLRAEIGQFRAEIRTDLGKLEAEIRTDLSKLEAKLDTIISMLGHLDTRVTRLEERIHPAS
jgi:flagellar motor switch protein FliM